MRRSLLTLFVILVATACKHRVPASEAKADLLQYGESPQVIYKYDDGQVYLLKCRGQSDLATNAPVIGFKNCNHIDPSTHVAVEMVEAVAFMTALKSKIGIDANLPIPTDTWATIAGLEETIKKLEELAVDSDDVATTDVARVQLAKASRDLATYKTYVRTSNDEPGKLFLFDSVTALLDVTSEGRVNVAAKEGSLLLKAFNAAAEVATSSVAVALTNEIVIYCYGNSKVAHAYTLDKKWNKSHGEPVKEAKWSSKAECIASISKARNGIYCAQSRVGSDGSKFYDLRSFSGKAEAMGRDSEKTCQAYVDQSTPKGFCLPSSTPGRYLPVALDTFRPHVDANGNRIYDAHNSLESCLAVLK